MTEYSPDYVPDNADNFHQALTALRCVETPDELRMITVAFVLDASYSRQDIYVAVRKVEREKGWG